MSQKNDESKINGEQPRSPSGRYVTLDFLRGISILGMLIIHLMINIYDLSWTNDIGSAPVFGVVATLILVYLGGWRGLFLMISGSGHMIAMLKALRKGIPLFNVVIKQLTNGIVLLVFAMLSESYLGYWGWIGQGIMRDNWDLEHYLYRSLNQHTIHAVAWSIIINSILFGLVMIKRGDKRPHFNAVIYGMLAIGVIAVTNRLWQWRSDLNNLYIAQNGYGLTSEWYKHGLAHAFVAILTNPIGGSPEPVFPFLSVLFIGNIIGIYLSEERPPKNMPQIGIILGIMCFVIAIIVGITMGATFDDWLPMRHPERVTKIDVWIPWFLFGIGGQLIVFMLMLRLVEYRGRTQIFAKRTAIFRRYGMVPFTVYNFQWFELLPRYIVGLAMGINILQGAAVNLMTTAIVLVIYFVLWTVGLYLWEKIGYAGSFEWMIGWITYGFNRIFTMKKKDPSTIMKSTKLSMKKTIKNPKWIDLSNLYDDGLKINRENRFLLTSAILSIVFFPSLLLTWSLLQGKKPKLLTKPEKSIVIAARIIFIYALVQFLSISIFLMTFTGLNL